MPQIDDAAQFIAEMRKVLTVVIGQAELEVEPEMGATIVYEKVPDQFLEVLAGDQWFESLCQFAPEAMAHRNWLEQVRALVLQWMVEDSKPAAPTKPEAAPAKRTKTAKKADDAAAP